MKLGVTFPHTEIGSDPAVIRDFAQAAEALGYHHLVAFDHVLGAHPSHFAGAEGPRFSHETPFHEVCVLYGYLAAVTTRLELAIGVMVLPQRQTALVAKQAAEVQVLSGGRLRLGVGIGWNFVEYEALGQTFRNRASRLEEQVAVPRRLWSDELVTYEGRYHTIRQAGINPRPARSIPIWMGGMAEGAVRRAARLADGWLPLFEPGPDGARALERLRGYVRAAGRRVEDFGVEGRLTIANVPEARWPAVAQGWRALGATHLSVRTTGAGLPSPRAHIEVLRRFRDVVGPLGEAES